jgi:hypothetical protein
MRHRSHPFDLADVQTVAAETASVSPGFLL